MTNKLFYYFLVMLTGFSMSCGQKEKQQPSGDYFEGVIYRDVQITPKTTKYSKEDLDRLAGNGVIDYYKEGNYYELTGNEFSDYSFFQAKTNRRYDKRANNDTLFWTDAAQPAQKLLKYEITPKKERVLGVLCDELKLYFEKKTNSAYYNSDSLKTNPAWYKERTMFNEDFMYSISRSHYYKYVSENEHYTLTITAKKIVHKKIDDDLFIPKGPEAKDPYFNTQ